MKVRILCWFGIAAVVCLIFAKTAAAQVCFTYSNDLAEYDSESLSSDGTTIYTLVEIDGSQEMDLQQGCLYFTPIHTPEATNTLVVGSQYVGGSQEGVGVCGSCYISFGNEQSIAPGASAVTLQSEVRADCNIGGTFFDTGMSEHSLRIADTSWGPPPIVQNDNCTWTILACASGTPTCTHVGGFTFSPGCPNYMLSQTLVVDGECLSGATVGTEQSGPGKCN